MTIDKGKVSNVASNDIYNLDKNYTPTIKAPDPIIKYIKRPYPESIHAEQAAILKLLKDRKLHDLVNASIYVCRIGRAGDVHLARPCPCCSSLIRAVGIRRVVYTNQDGSTSHYDVV